MWTRRACTEFYNAGPQGFAGDEDNGEMSAWYLLSALGFYPLTPGRAEYVLDQPVVSQGHDPPGERPHVRGGRVGQLRAKRLRAEAGPTAASTRQPGLRTTA